VPLMSGQSKRIYSSQFKFTIINPQPRTVIIRTQFLFHGYSKTVKGFRKNYTSMWYCRLTVQCLLLTVQCLLNADGFPLCFAGAGGDASGRSKQSRSEKKSRKAMQKLGMKTITGVSRVTIKKSKNVSCLITVMPLFLVGSQNCYIPLHFA
jgi:hypothetical protein